MWTNTREFWLMPRPAPGQYADNQDNPFKDLHSNSTLKLGLYGIHIDSRHNSLEKVIKAKAFAKAIKADNVEVPVHLFNDSVRTPGIKDAQRDVALNMFWRLGDRWFLKGLVGN